MSTPPARRSRAAPAAHRAAGVNTRSGPLGGDEVEIGHAAPEQRVARAEVVVDVEAGHHRGEALARLVHAQQLGHDLAQRLGASSPRLQRGLRHRVAQHARGDRVALGVVGVEQALRRRPLDHLRQLPAQVHRVLHADVEALPADRRVHVRRVAGEQHASCAVRRRLPRHVGEPRDPGRAVDAEVGAVDGDERLAEIAQRRLARPDCDLGQHHADRPAPVDDLAVRSRTRPCRCAWMPVRVAADAQRAAPRSSRPRRSGSSSSDPSPGSRCRPPCGPGCARRRSRRGTARAATRPSDSATSTPRVVLREARHLAPAIDRHAAARRPSRPGCARCGSASSASP